MKLIQVTSLTLVALSSALVSNAASITLVEFDFAGSGGVSSYATNNSQFTTIDAGVTFEDTTSAVTAVNSWNYDGTNTAAVRGDLMNSTAFGSTSRIDVDLGFAATGFSYTITSAEIDIRANNDDGSTFAFGYRDLNNVTHVVGGTSVATQAGTAPISTYAVDLSSEGLAATINSTTWDTGGTGELRFLFYDATTGETLNDNFQIDAVRLIGNVVPEPSSYALIAGMLGLTFVGLRRRK